MSNKKCIIIDNNVFRRIRRFKDFEEFFLDNLKNCTIENDLKIPPGLALEYLGISRTEIPSLEINTFMAKGVYDSYEILDQECTNANCKLKGLKKASCSGPDCVGINELQDYNDKLTVFFGDLARKSRDFVDNFNVIRRENLLFKLEEALERTYTESGEQIYSILKTKIEDDNFIDDIKNYLYIDLVLSVELTRDNKKYLNTHFERYIIDNDFVALLRDRFNLSFAKITKHISDSMSGNRDLGDASEFSKEEYEQILIDKDVVRKRSGDQIVLVRDLFDAELVHFSCVGWCECADTYETHVFTHDPVGKIEIRLALYVEALKRVSSSNELEDVIKSFEAGYVYHINQTNLDVKVIEVSSISLDALLKMSKLANEQ